VVRGRCRGRAGRLRAGPRDRPAGPDAPAVHDRGGHRDRRAVGRAGGRRLRVRPGVLLRPAGTGRGADAPAGPHVPTHRPAPGRPGALTYADTLSLVVDPYLVYR